MKTLLGSMSAPTAMALSCVIFLVGGVVVELLATMLRVDLWVKTQPVLGGRWRHLRCRYLDVVTLLKALLFKIPSQLGNRLPPNHNPPIVIKLFPMIFARAAN